MTSTNYDILVIGGGNAGVSAAITAARLGLTVMVLESAPKDFRGGNTRHTRNFRCMHDKPLETMVEAYPEEEYWEDLLRVTGGQTNEQLARMAIRRSEACYDWMKAQGVRFQPALGPIRFDGSPPLTHDRSRAFAQQPFGLSPQLPRQRLRSTRVRRRI